MTPPSSADAAPGGRGPLCTLGIRREEAPKGLTGRGVSHLWLLLGLPQKKQRPCDAWIFLSNAAPGYFPADPTSIYFVSERGTRDTSQCNSCAAASLHTCRRPGRGRTAGTRRQLGCSCTRHTLAPQLQLAVSLSAPTLQQRALLPRLFRYCFLMILGGKWWPVPEELLCTSRCSLDNEPSPGLSNRSSAAAPSCR